uniref:Uncharacterized protein n=1 Tax=Caenorhabditis japonica TaxID=281687 RepID=A0A8R1IBR3_CAEJA
MEKEIQKFYSKLFRSNRRPPVIASPIGMEIPPPFLPEEVPAEREKGDKWFSVFSQWVSRSRRATFNEENLLLTYQPRAYTHGHLFVPEPPTPARFNQGESTDGAASDFKAARDAHYKDEFHAAMNAKVDKKPNQFMNVESMRIEFDDSSPSPSSSGSTVNSGKSPSFHI